MKGDPSPVPDTLAPAPGESDPAPHLDAYWDALQRGAAAGPEEWSAAQPEGRPSLDMLRLVKELHDAVQTLREDSSLEDPATESYAVPIQQTRQAPLEPGVVLGRCRIDKCLGKGGMGEVYLAEHQVMGNLVAVKVVAAHLAANEVALSRFRKEVRTLAALRPHPNVAAAFDAGDYEGRPYLVMEYVPGTDLRQYVARHGGLPVAEACVLARQVALGLDYIHRHGIIHRDLKPSNLVLTPEQQVKILDLGLARLAAPTGAGGDASLTPAGAMLGTLDYMAPEQARDPAAADARSDLYSLGCTFYSLLTGRAPFQDYSHLMKLAAHAIDAVPPIAQFRFDVPRAVVQLVEKLLAKRPEDRYQSAGEFIKALDAAAGESLQAPTATAPGRKPGRMPWLQGRWRVGLTAGVVFVVLGVVLLALAGTLLPRIWNHGQAPPGPPVALESIQVWVGDEHRTELARLIPSDRSAILDELLPPQRGFLLEGKFNRPTFWYIVWFDTAGAPPKLSEHEHSRLEQAELKYPLPAGPKDELQKVDSNDPEGTHAIVVVAGSVPPEQAIVQIQEQLAGIGKPPAVGGRGAGATIQVNSETPAHYLERIDEKLPPGLVRAYALFFTTKK
jgi:hypothetical protein